jgi:tetratricopeptide (TPR) repeat protein
MPLLARQWDEKRLSSVLIHEQEHVRRCDPLVEWLTLVNRSIYWFHPLSWWLRRHLNILAEQACDEAVINNGIDPELYTELLLDLARSVKQKGILDLNSGLSFQGGSLMKRIQNIVTGGSGPTVSRFRLGLISVFCIAVILVPLTCQLIPAEEYPSQNAVYLVSKGISAEEDAGDLNAALAYYRQVLNTPSDQKIYAAFAQFRITQILLQKGKLVEAAQEFEILARTYPEYSDLVSLQIAQDQNGVLHSRPAFQNSTQAIGTIRDNRYHHNLSGFEFSLENWSVVMQSLSSGGGEMVVLQNEDANALQAKVWMKPDRIATADITSRLRGSLQEKVIQRLSARGYSIRPASVQFSTINGKQALYAMADYVESDNTPMTEYLAWIYTEKTRVFFFAHSSAVEFPALKSFMDQLVSTAIVP